MLLTLSVILETIVQDQSFDILIGEKLSSVTFVMDYLQIDFDGNQFTFYIWPVVTSDKIKYQFGDLFYRDKLCSLIAKVVAGVIIKDNEVFEIHFENNDELTLSLDPTNPDIVTEIAIFTDVEKNWYVFE
jgi:hypothetical protein